jgi:hypothetical protein
MRGHRLRPCFNLRFEGHERSISKGETDRQRKNINDCNIASSRALSRELDERPHVSGGYDALGQRCISRRCRGTGKRRSRLPKADQRSRPGGRGAERRVIEHASARFGGSESESTSDSRPLNTSRMDLFSVALSFMPATLRTGKNKVAMALSAA